MDPTDARNLACARHGEARNRVGERIVEHLDRVAASVPGDARSIAYLHDILEHTDTSIADLEAEGLAPVELEAVRLLTRPPDESFEAHTLRIAYAKGPEGQLARAVKLADIEDHVAQGNIPPDRPYGWAWRLVAAGRARCLEP